jgi:hypothetical protein
MKKLLTFLLLLSTLCWPQGISYPSTTNIFSGAGNVSLNNFTAIKVFSSNIGTGDIDFSYTVPTGSRAVFVAFPWNSTASSITYYPEVKIGGTYYPTAVKQTLANTTSATTNAALTYAIILEAGQKFAINTTGTGLNIVGTIYQFDTSSAVKSSVITTFINGNNTVYTCCSVGKNSAFILGHIASFYSGAATVGNLWGFNNTAGTLSYTWNFVPSGGSAGTSNQVGETISAAATSGTPVAFTHNIEMAFNSGDLVSVNSTSTNANQIAWVNVVEQ